MQLNNKQNSHEKMRCAAKANATAQCIGIHEHVEQVVNQADRCSHQSCANKVSLRASIPATLLVAGNVLGVGVLALPIKLGVSGYSPTILDIFIICGVMLISAFVIAERLPADKDNFDIPSFFHQELGKLGRWIAIVCNLIILYGVLIAYLSGISSIFHELFKIHVPQSVVIVGYFCLVTSLIVFGRKMLRRGNTVLLIAVFLSFVALICSGSAKFQPHLLTYVQWKYVPLGLPIIVSAFHFHNVIPTVSNCVQRNQKVLRKVITGGVLIGLVMNLIWVTITLGSLPEYGAHGNGIVCAFLHNLPATVPMTRLLHSKVFTIAGLAFAMLAVSASYVANGAGLFGFMKDLVYHHLHTDNKMMVALLSFIPPLVITLIYPHIFLVALDIVGGVGETILFVILPGIILMRMGRRKSKLAYSVGAMIAAIGLFIMLFIIGQKFGWIHLQPPEHFLPNL